MIELTRINKKHHGRTRLRFNTGQTLDVPSPVLGELDLQEGKEYQLEKLREDVWNQCRELLPERARSHLARYTKTTGEFEEHFTRKGYPEEIVSEVKEQLKAEGALDDEGIARLHVQQRLENKDYGRQKIMAELREKGIESGKARNLVDEIYPIELEHEKAREYRNDHEDLATRKLISRLKSRGFKQSTIRDVVGYPE